MNRSEQKEQTRRRILEAADTCFQKKGMAYTLISDIVHEAGISVGAFYHHFPNKESIIIDNFSNFDFYFADQLDELLSPKDALEALTLFAKTFSRDALSEEARTRSIEYLKARPSVTMTELLPVNRPYFLILCTVLALGQQRKQIRRDMSPIELGELYMVMVRGYSIDWAGTNGSYPLNERLSKHLPVMLAGLTAPIDGPYDGTVEVFPEQTVPENYKDCVSVIRTRCEEYLAES